MDSLSGRSTSMKKAMMSHTQKKDAFKKTRGAGLEGRGYSLK